MLQIHIGGPKRSGKSTLAKLLEQPLFLKGFRPVILDIDEVRRGIFGEAGARAKIGSPENQQFHAWAFGGLFQVAIPAVLKAGGVPIAVGGHSRRKNYDDAVRIAAHYGASLRFILVDAPSWEETVRRAKSDTESFSDVTDLGTDLDQQRSYWEQKERFAQSYGDFQEPHLRLAQGTPEQVVEAAMRFILD